MARAAGSPAASGRPWRRGLLWLTFLGPFFFTSYGYSNWLAAQRADVGAIVFDWERHIPFIPWTIVPYWCIDLFYVLSLLLPRTRYELDAHAKRLLTAQIISVACFIAIPLRFTFDRPVTDGVSGWLFNVLLGFDKPFNQAPSLHISLLVILWTLYAKYLNGAWLWLLRIVAVAIGLSVLTTYQHHFIDVPTGMLAGCLAVLLFPLQQQETNRQRDPRRFVLAACYFSGTVVLTAMATMMRGGWLWLLWPACSLATVAGIYVYGAPSLFRKTRGRIEEAVAVLLAPYLIGAWINSRLWTFTHPAPGEIVPGLWLSRWPSSSEVLALKPQSLVDCCAELTVGTHGLQLFSIPMLDLLVPETNQITRGVAALDAALKHGDTVIFCALGYSRSAMIVVAWLLAHGHATNIDAALGMARRARPRLSLSPVHIARLKDWHEQRSRD